MYGTHNDGAINLDTPIGAPCSLPGVTIGRDVSNRNKSFAVRDNAILMNFINENGKIIAGRITRTQIHSRRQSERKRSRRFVQGNGPLMVDYSGENHPVNRG